MKSLQGREFNKWQKAKKGNFIKSSLKDEYHKRLRSSSIINGKSVSFEKQFNQGSGQELKEKFWSEISSSRMAFDLYSWIATDSSCVEFQFEKKLVAIKSGGRKVNSNMDVFIRKANNEIWFIESKFTERPQNIKKLSEVYYATRDREGNLVKDGNDYNSLTWYYKSNKADGLAKASVNERFLGKEEVARQYIEFVTRMMELSEKTEINEWFDAKQECCHLLGIIMFILNDTSARNSKVHFRNVVYGKKENFIEREEFATTFMVEATKMVNAILSHYKLENITFDYGALTIQSVLDKYGEKKAVGYDNKTVAQSIIDNFEGLIQ